MLKACFGGMHQEFDQSMQGVRWLATPSTCVQFTPRSDDFAVDSTALTTVGCVFMMMGTYKQRSRGCKTLILKSTTVLKVISAALKPPQQ